jgi:hypothetical protein
MDPAALDIIFSRASSNLIVCGNAVEAVDEDQFPLFQSAPYLDVEIGPGECLFIPRGHVRPPHPS